METALELVRRVVVAVSTGDLEKAYDLAPQSRVALADLRQVLKDHPERIVQPPEAGWCELELVKTDLTDIEKWYIAVPLWTELGKSDLTLELSLEKCGSLWSISIDDLHVL